MAVKGGRLEFLVPHLLRSQVLRPRFVRLSLRLGVARQMPRWAKLQFLNCGVCDADLDRVLRRINSLESWVDQWEALGVEQHQVAEQLLQAGRSADARDQFLAASASFNFAQYVVFLDTTRKRRLHDACVAAYARAAQWFDPPAVPFDVPFRGRTLRGYLRVPPGLEPAPVVVLFNGTNSVKEELHWWSEALLARGVATVVFDGPGLGETFHRMSMVAEPRPVGHAIVNALQERPELDPESIAFFGQSLGGYLAIRMAAYDPRIRAVAAVSPPYSVDVYWNVTLVGMRRELAALYGLTEAEMGREVHRITLDGTIHNLRCPLMVSGGGRDLITPGEEAWRIYDAAHCERELVFYPRGGHDCFNMLGDLRPRMTTWLARQLKLQRSRSRRPYPVYEANGETKRLLAAEAVDPDFADALTGEAPPRRWHQPESQTMPARWALDGIDQRPAANVEIVLRRSSATAA